MARFTRKSSRRALTAVGALTIGALALSACAGGGGEESDDNTLTL